MSVKVEDKCRLKGGGSFETLVRKIAAICHPLRLDGTKKDRDGTQKKLKREVDGSFWRKKTASA